MTQFSFQRLDDGTWGVKASGNLDQATKYAGQTVQVRKRDGSIQTVQLGALVAKWNGGRAATYAKVSAPVVAFATPRASGSSVASAMASFEVQDALADEADDDAEAEYDDFTASEYDAAIIGPAYANAEKVGDMDRGSYYDTTTYLVALPGVDPNRVRRYLSRSDGQNAYAYGSFGGYSTIGKVSADPSGRGVLVESIYHIGD